MPLNLLAKKTKIVQFVKFYCPVHQGSVHPDVISFHWNEPKYFSLIFLVWYRHCWQITSFSKRSEVEFDLFVFDNNDEEFIFIDLETQKRSLSLPKSFFKYVLEESALLCHYFARFKQKIKWAEFEGETCWNEYWIFSYISDPDNLWNEEIFRWSSLLIINSSSRGCNK